MADILNFQCRLILSRHFPSASILKGTTLVKLTSSATLSTEVNLRIESKFLNLTDVMLPRNRKQIDQS